MSSNPDLGNERFKSIVAAIGTICVSLTAGATGAAASGSTCPGTTSYPFAQFGDANPYVLVPGGSFEGKTTGWTLTGAAKVVSGNETFLVNSSADTKSLSIPAGASATTPAICVTFWNPTIRFFATGGSSTSGLRVDVITTLPGGTVVTQQIATISSSGSWSATPATYFFANLLAPLSGGTTNVQFRFTPLGGTGFKIDDLYIDPRKGV